MADFKINGKNVVPQSGSAEPVLASNVMFPAGHVIQVVSTTKLDQMSFNTSGGWVTVTGMNTTLQAIQSGSKNLVSVVVHYGCILDSTPTGRCRESIEELVQLPSAS